MAFRGYTPRSPELLEKRANQNGSDFIGFIKNEYKLYTVRKGENHIRILPPTWENPDHYGLDIFVHYGIGPERQSALCLAKMNNTRCPICEARARYERANPPDEEMIKELRASNRVLVWMLDMMEVEKGPQLWAMPKGVDRDIIKVQRDKQTGAVYVLDDPDNGYDLFFEKIGEKLQTKYTGFQVSRHATQVDDAPLDFVEDHPLPDVLWYRDYAETLEMYEGAALPEPEPSTPRRRVVEEPPARSRRDAPPPERDAPARASRAAPPADEPAPVRTRTREAAAAAPLASVRPRERMAPRTAADPHPELDGDGIPFLEDEEPTTEDVGRARAAIADTDRNMRERTTRPARDVTPPPTRSAASTAQALKEQFAARRAR